MQYAAFGLLCGCISLLTGCQKAADYEIASTSDGRVLRLEKHSGEVAVVLQDRVVRLASTLPRETDIFGRAPDPPKLSQNWGSLYVAVPAKTTAVLESSRYLDTFRYRVTLSPVPEDLRTAVMNQSSPIRGLVLHLLDKSGFDIATSTIATSDALHKRSANGGHTAIVFQGQLSLTETELSRATTWGISWDFK